MTRPRAVALISGRGSNLGALLKAELPIDWALVLSNRPGVGGLEIARQAGIPTVVLDHQDYASREAFDAAMQTFIDEALKPTPIDDYRSQGLVVLAGFMRILSPGFVKHYRSRMLNIHPSLLPKFKGLHTHQQALEAGESVHGCSVHWVTAELDHGPVLAQASVPILEGDTEATLAARVLVEEHRLYPYVLGAWARGEMVPEPTGFLRLKTPYSLSGAEGAS